MEWHLNPFSIWWQDKAAGLALQLPWKRFPSEMPELGSLVSAMTQRNMSLRPSAAQALKHDAFLGEGQCRAWRVRWFWVAFTKQNAHKIAGSISSPGVSGRNSDLGTSSTH